MIGGKWKRSSPRGNRLASVMNTIAVRRLFILEFSRWPPFEREPIGSFGEKRRAGRLGLQAAEFAGKTSWNCLIIFSSAERRERIQNKLSQARSIKKREVK